MKSVSVDTPNPNIRNGPGLNLRMVLAHIEDGLQKARAHALNVIVQNSKGKDSWLRRVSVMSLGRLRRVAKLNLCEKCYKTYLRVIEPSVGKFLFEPLSDFGEIQSYITQMVMKHKGVFKENGLVLLSLDKDEKLPEEISGKIDLEAYWKIEFWKFKDKIDYLKKHRILKGLSYELIDEARKIRNILHKYEYKFTEQGLWLISQALGVTSLIHQAVMWTSDEKWATLLLNTAERRAQEILKKYEQLKATAPPPKFSGP